MGDSMRVTMRERTAKGAKEHHRLALGKVGHSSREIGEQVCAHDGFHFDQ